MVVVANLCQVWSAACSEGDRAKDLSPGVQDWEGTCQIGVPSIEPSGTDQIFPIRFPFRVPGKEKFALSPSKQVADATRQWNKYLKDPRLRG